MTMPSCDVLLATYNSERWLEPLLRSLAAQDHIDFRLVVADDASADNTIAILERHAANFPGGMEIHRNFPPSGDAIRNFDGLMKRSTAEYIFFCDHDDIWMPDKISTLLTHTRRLEEQATANTPIYVFSDAQVIDAEGQLTAQSFWDYKKYDPAFAKSLPHLLVCPPMIGCASVVNRACLQRASPVPLLGIGHDWWSALVANIFGTIDFNPQKTIQYRIHGSNVSRPRRITPGILMSTTGKRAIVRQGIQRRIGQAAALLKAFGSSLPDDKKRVLERYVDLASLGPIERRARLLQDRFLYPDFYRNAAQLALI